MGETLPRHYLYGVVIFTLFIVGGVFFVTEFSGDGVSSIDSDRTGSFNRTFNKMDSLSSTTSELRRGAKVEPASTVVNLATAFEEWIGRG